MLSILLLLNLISLDIGEKEIADNSVNTEKVGKEVKMNTKKENYEKNVFMINIWIADLKNKKFLIVCQ